MPLIQKHPRTSRKKPLMLMGNILGKPAPKLMTKT